ncbi:YdbC family protein [Schleiferilactobacillus harbinensis]|uniref:YdbC family protein n=1 Tax=Schleiferilactobacillus harbinensis TaxID=304207 RepID=UPI0007B9DF2F|nr:YdbC family protein [Schleiferilactobacillus harbinensis]
MARKNTGPIQFKVEETIGVLSTSANGWQKELNLVSWNDAPPKFDIRSWSPDHTKMGKGITLTNEEMAALKETIQQAGL